MAHFRGSLLGVSGKAVTRLGGPTDGMTSRVDGWTEGVEVCARVKGEPGPEQEDVFEIYSTHGSMGSRHHLIGIVTRGGVFTPAQESVGE